MQICRRISTVSALLWFFVKRQLWRQSAICAMNVNATENNCNGQESRHRRKVITSSKLLVSGAVNSSDGRENVKFRNQVLTRLQGGEISNIVKSDFLICKFSSSLYRRQGDNRILEINQRLRLLARLLIEINTK